MAPTTPWRNDANAPRRDITTRSLATAHDQMSESVLERVVVDFWEKRFDVLVSITIVESGIGISNANTLIRELPARAGEFPTPVLGG